MFFKKHCYLTEETLAKNEVGVGKVGEGLQKDLHHYMHLVRHLQKAIYTDASEETRSKTHHMEFLFLLHVRVSWVELVELQQGQVCFQVIPCDQKCVNNGCIPNIL